MNRQLVLAFSQQSSGLSENWDLFFVSAESWYPRSQHAIEIHLGILIMMHDETQSFRVDVIQRVFTSQPDVATPPVCPDMRTGGPAGAEPRWTGLPLRITKFRLEPEIFRTIECIPPEESFGARRWHNFHRWSGRSQVGHIEVEIIDEPAIAARSQAVPMFPIDEEHR
ncbi:MAG: hypothetical protein JSS02_07420 [Planctomycetes bacterium]|nr:hypothetical protein [Planctomycetota bacterium]